MASFSAKLLNIDLSLATQFTTDNFRPVRHCAMQAYKYRLYPDAEQEALIARHFGCARHVYNWALSEKDRHYKETGKSLLKRQIQDMLVASKKADKVS